MECLQNAVELQSELANRKKKRLEDSATLLFNEKEVRHIMKQLFEGCSHLHKMGITHRDIKPQNMLVDMSTGLLKIIDFGLARKD